MNLVIYSGDELLRRSRPDGAQGAFLESDLYIELSEQDKRRGFLVAGASADGYAVKQLSYNSRAFPGDGKLLLAHFTEYAKMLGARRLCYDFLAYDEGDRARLKELLSSCGWGEPLSQAVMLRVNANGLLLDENIRKNAEKSASGDRIKPFFDISYVERARFVLGAGAALPDYLDLTRLRGAIPELSLAYTADGELRGFFVCTESDGDIELRMAYMPEEAKAYTVLMIGRLLQSLGRMYEQAPPLRICAVSADSEKLARRVFENRIIKTARLYSAEYSEAQSRIQLPN